MVYPQSKICTVPTPFVFNWPILHGSRPYGRLSHSTLASHQLEIFETSSIMASQPTPTNVHQKQKLIQPYWSKPMINIYKPINKALFLAEVRWGFLVNQSWFMDRWWIFADEIFPPKPTSLDGGWTNPFEKYTRLKDPSKHQKSLKPQPRTWIILFGWESNSLTLWKKHPPPNQTPKKGLKEAWKLDIPWYLKDSYRFCTKKGVDIHVVSKPSRLLLHPQIN